MDIKEYKKMLKEETPKKILLRYCNRLINLTNKQLKEVLERKKYERFN